MIEFEFEKVLKGFDIPNIKDIDEKDAILINESIKTKNIMILIAIILRILGKNKLLSNTIITMSKEISELTNVNTNLINASNILNDRVTIIENKIKNIFIADINGKQTH